MLLFSAFCSFSFWLLILPSIMMTTLFDIVAVPYHFFALSVGIRSFLLCKNSVLCPFICNRILIFYRVISKYHITSYPYVINASNWICIVMSIALFFMHHILYSFRIKLWILWIMRVIPVFLLLFLFYSLPK